MAIRESSYGYWSSPAAFVWVAAGATIGVGNVTRLPYLAGEYGGAAFLLVYVLALLLVGWPLLVAEWMMGRWARQDLVSGMSRLALAAGARRTWAGVGWLGLACAVLILSYYSVIAGWSLAYVFRAAAGSLAALDTERTREVFFALALDPERGLAWHTIFMVMACIIVTHGLRDGLERSGRYLTTAAFALALALLLAAVLRGNLGQAIAYLWAPDFGRLGWRGAMEALHQAFFTLSLGIGAMFTYGSYLPGDARLPRLGLAVIALDTLFGLAMGTAVYALLFAGGQTATPGLALIFESMPQALPHGWAGIPLAIAFYGVLVMITLASATALMEPATRYVMERLRITRVFAATSVALVIWFLGLGTLLSFGSAFELSLFGRSIFECLQWLTARLLAPVSALLICIFAGRIMPRGLTDEAWGVATGAGYRSWRLAISYSARVGIIVLVAYCLGLVDRLVSLWS